MNFDFLEELEHIFNFANTAPSVKETIDKLKETDIDRLQQKFIYDLVTFAYELGKKESMFI